MARVKVNNLNDLLQKFLRGYPYTPPTFHNTMNHRLILFVNISREITELSI